MRIITHQQAQNNNLYTEESYIVTDSKINLDNGYSYLDILDGFFIKDNQVIAMTRLERKLIKCLVDNKGVVSYDTIYKEVWNKQKISIYTLRNMVNNIRGKSYYDVIVNVSNQGYILGGKSDNK